MKMTRLQRLLNDKDITIIEAVISHLRAQSPRLVPTSEIAYVVRRSNTYVYGLIKKARELTALSTGEFISNTAKRKNKPLFGYTITRDARAAMFESYKSFDRADGHAAAGIATKQRINHKELKSNEDIALWLATEARADGAAMMLRASERAKAVCSLNSDNQRFSGASRAETATPWETLGFENHHTTDFEDDDT